MRSTLLSFFFIFPLLVSAQCELTEITITTQSANYGPEMGWSITNQNGIALYTFGADADFASYEDVVCLADGCYIFAASDTYGDGWNGGTVSININGEIINYALSDGYGEEFAFGVNQEGCQLDGPCALTTVSISTLTEAYGPEVGWEIQDNEGNLEYIFAADADNSSYTDNVCLGDGCYVFIATDTYGDGWNGGSVSLEINGEIINYELTQGSQEAIAFGVNVTGCEVIIPGCTNPDALNYEPAATVDDGSCLTIQDYLDSQNITPLIQSGPIHNRINFGIQNRSSGNANNDFANEAEFIQMLEDSLVACFTNGDPLAKEPYARYRNFFNIDAWWWENAPAQGQGWSWDILKGLRDEYYLPWQDDEHGWATLFSTIKYGGGGGAGVQPETRTGDGFMFGVGWETLLHEFGHTMPQVPDEYTASGEWSGGNCWEGPNTTAWTVRDSIPWRMWIDPETPLPTPYTDEYVNTVGAFEGALTNYFGCHRASARGCYMGAGGFGPEFGQDLCVACRQRVVCHLYRYVDVIENPIPSEANLSVSGSETISFSADVVKPEPNTQTYTWLLNGQIIGEGSESIEVTFGSCDSYELTLVVEDTTSWVRYDELFDHLYPKPMETHTWFIDQSEVETYDLSAELSATFASCSGENDGQVSFDVSGGNGPYNAWYEGLEVGLLHDGLTPGSYNYWVTDAEGCGVQESVVIGQETLLQLNVCTEFTESWSADLTITGYDPEECEILWSNGSDELNSGALDQGAQWVSVTTPNGCERILDFEVDEVPSPLVASAERFASSPDEPTGSVYLNISGGSAPYSIRWYDKLARDLTEANPDGADASGFSFGHLPEMAFDDDIYTKWLQMGTGNIWLSFAFDQPEQINYYAIMSGDDVEDRDPQDWELQGSANGTDWVTLDQRTNQDFPERRLRRGFSFENESAFTYYRLYINANAGADATQLQELELIGTSDADDFVYNPLADDLMSRSQLAPGEYQYNVQDQNSLCASENIPIGSEDIFTPEGLIVIQESSCTVAIESPNPSLEYYWFDSEEGNTILGTGSSFEPPAGGNYWVSAVDPELGVMSENRPGFAVTMPPTPEVTEVSEGTLGIVDPDPELVYRWYDMSCGGTLLFEGTEYTPGTEAVTLYVGAWWAEELPEAIDPTSVNGLIVRMDAADLDGDGVMDDPRPESSSLYDWAFNPGSQWSDGSWFAYRGNYQNGLGIADFATMWLQCIDDGFSGYQTVVMAYKENAMSFEGSAPFYGMSDRMPYSELPGLQLYSNDVPASTLNGITMLNGEVVDPMETANPLEFCVLGQTFTQAAGNTDCSHTHWEGMIGEILFYEDELSEEELAGLSEFLRKKWISLADLESKRVEIIWDGSGIGIDEPEAETAEGVSVYPNPSDGMLAIDVRSINSSVVRVELFDMSGRLLYSASAEGEKEIIRLDREFSALQSGYYLVRISTEDGRSFSKTVIRH